ncbi:MAG: hypothetical protein JWO94_1968 [Verrucomicrobiaceae bacterium]|nr:hypothetical protein [Verrucomicrobiaceae bacterium]
MKADSNDHPGADGPSRPTRDYWCFISYRHSDNKEPGRQWATWLHQALETYEVPSDLVGTTNERGDTIPERIFPVFRDEEELPADAQLSRPIEAALRHSRFLLVLCSPQAVKSHFVAEEILRFKQLGKQDSILAAIIEGEPNAINAPADGNAAKECFPEPLRFALGQHGGLSTTPSEPIAADFRLANGMSGWTTIGAYREALKSAGMPDKQIAATVTSYSKQQNLMLLKIVAGVLGVPVGILTARDKAYQLEKARKRARIFRLVAAAMTILLAIASVAGIAAWKARNESEVQKNVAIALRDQAQKQKQLAESSEKQAIKEADNARQIADFLHRLLSSAAAEVAHGKNPDALIAAVETQAPTLSKSFGNQPELQYRLTLELSIIYGQFGLHREALPLSRQVVLLARQIYGPSNETTLQRMRWLAMEELTGGNIDASLGLVKECLELRKKLGQGAETNDEMLRDLRLLADTLAGKDRKEEAKAVYQQLVSAYEGRRKNGEARDSESLGLYSDALAGAGKPEEALAVLDEYDAVLSKATTPDTHAIKVKMKNRMRLQRLVGREDEAFETCMRNINLEKKFKTSDNLGFALELNDRAKFLFEGKHWPQAEATIDVALKAAGMVENHATLAESHGIACNIFRAQGKMSEAETHARAACEEADKGHLGWKALLAQKSLIELLGQSGRLAEATSLGDTLWRRACQGDAPGRPVNGVQKLADDTSRFFFSLNQKAPSPGLIEQVKNWRERAADSLQWDAAVSDSVWNAAVSPFVWRAACRARDGKFSDYEKDRTRFLERTKNTSDWGLAEKAKMALLLPCDGTCLQEALALTEQSLKISPKDNISLAWSHLGRGLAYYRAGKYEAALSMLQALLQDRDRTRWYSAASISAMALQRLGRHEPALVLMRSIQERSTYELVYLDDPLDQNAVMSGVLLGEARNVVKL